LRTLVGVAPSTSGTGLEMSRGTSRDSAAGSGATPQMLRAPERRGASRLVRSRREEASIAKVGASPRGATDAEVKKRWVKRPSSSSSVRLSALCGRRQRDRRHLASFLHPCVRLCLSRLSVCAYRKAPPLIDIHVATQSLPQTETREHERAPRRHRPTGHRSPRPHTRPLTPLHTSAAPYGLDDSTRTRHTLVTPSGTPPPTTHDGRLCTSRMATLCLIVWGAEWSRVAHTFLALTTLAHLTTSLCRALSLSLARDGRG
jgi:hypothetical protein